VAAEVKPLLAQRAAAPYFTKENFTTRETTPMPSSALLQSEVPGFPVRRGKVRDVYDLGDRLVIVATDRISAFDWILPTPIPDKGRVLTGLTLFWLDMLKVPNHLISVEPREMGPAFAAQRDVFEGRSMLVKKATVVPIECVARGYLAGSGWKEYKKGRTVCGIPLPDGLAESQQLPEPIFTPATKEDSGHDFNISFEEMCRRVGSKLSEQLRWQTLDIYRRAAEFARSKGIIIADTKFEWGLIAPTTPPSRPAEENVILIDEVLTPDSSRFWPADQYRTGISPPSFDKQFVRDWLEATPWDKNSPPPSLPDDIVQRTRAKYIEGYERLTGKPFGWK
jgi:phosphoribosylaminoimidazole-succinocarboxamide synthase